MNGDFLLGVDILLFSILEVAGNSLLLGAAFLLGMAAASIGAVLRGRRLAGCLRDALGVFAGRTHPTPAQSPDVCSFRWNPQDRQMRLCGQLGAWLAGQGGCEREGMEFLLSQDAFFALLHAEEKQRAGERLRACWHGELPLVDLTLRVHLRAWHPAAEGENHGHETQKTLRLLAGIPEAGRVRAAARPDEVRGVLLDVSWQAQTEALLRQASFDRMLISGNLPCLLVQWNELGIIVQASPYAERYFGQGKLAGRPMRDLIAADALPEYLGKVRQYIDDIASRPEHYTNLFLRMRSREGTSVVAWTSHLGVNDGMRTVVSLGLDVTAACRAEEELRRSDSEKEVILASISEGVVYLSADLQILWANDGAERLSRLRRPELVGQRCHTVYCGAPQECERCPVCRARREGRRAQGVRRLPDGRLVSISAAPVLTGGRLTGVVKTLSDVTRQSEMEIAQRNAQKMQMVGQLAGGIAHDFNNRLCGLLGFAGLLQETALDYSQREYLRSMIGSAEHCADMTRKLLAFSRQGRYCASPVDLNKLCAEVSELAGVAEGGDWEVVRELREPAIVEGDQTLLRNLLMTLVFNARDAMAGRGRLSLRTEPVRLSSALAVTDQEVLPADDYVRIEVSDTGCGIAPEAMPHIFEPFFTTKDRAEGRGMSLAAAYGTVKSHGGAMVPLSMVGEGTTFVVYLPVQIKEYPEPAGTSTEVAAAGEGEDLLPAGGAEPVFAQRKVLIIGSDSYDRVALREGGRRLGSQVLLAESGPDGLALARKVGADVVVIDLSVRIIGALAVFREIREGLPQAAILLYGRADQREEAKFMLERGASGFLCKPLNIERVRDQIMGLFAAEGAGGAEGEKKMRNA